MTFDWRGNLILTKLSEGSTLAEAAAAAAMTRQGVWWRCGISSDFAQAVAAAREAGRAERTFRLWLRHPYRGRRGPWCQPGRVPAFRWGRR